MLTTADAIRRRCLDARADDRCIGVIAWMHTFSPAKMWIAGLQALGKPLLHLHTQANRSLPWSSIDMDFMNLNQAAHGDREFASVQTRMGIDRKTVFGHVDDAEVQQDVGRWVRAAAGWHETQHLRLARFGDNMRDVAVTEGDKVAAQMRFGVSVNTWSVNELAAAVADATDADVATLVQEYGDTYTMATDLAPGGDRHESVREAARIELGLRSFLSDGGFGAFTTNFQDLGALRQLPGLAVQRLMADGYGFGGEGDWKTSLLVRAVKVMGAGLPGGTSFMEDYTYHLGPGAPKTLGAHMLEVCPSIAAGRPSLEVHALSIGDREDPARLVFDAAPGRAIVMGLADLGDRFRFVANEIDTVPARRAPACVAGGEGGVDLSPRSANLHDIVAHRRGPTPHGLHVGGRPRDARGLRHDRRRRACVHRRRNDGPLVPRRAALECGLVPPGARNMTGRPPHYRLTLRL